MSLLSNPAFSAGMSILAANQGSALQPIGQGFTQASQQDQQRKLLEMKQRQAESMEKYRQMQMRQLEMQMNQPPERKIRDVDGVPYYIDTGEPVIPDATRRPQTNLGKLKSEQAAFPPGSPEWQYYQKAIEKEITNLPSGMTMGDDGRPQYMPEYIEGQRMMRAAGQPQTNINMPNNRFGTIPPGYMVKETDQGAMMVPVPGSPAEREAAQQEDASRSQTRGTARVAGFVLRDARYIQENLEKVDNNPVIRQVKARVPGTPEYEVGREIQSLQSSIAIDSLIDLKRQGGTLGAVPQQQLMTLAQLMGDLDITREPARLRQIMGDIQSTYLEVLNNMTPEERAMVGVAEREFESLNSIWGSQSPQGQGGGFQPTGDAARDAEMFLQQFGGQ